MSLIEEYDHHVCELLANRDKTMSLRPLGYISSECPSIVSKPCGVSDQMDFDNMSATHPLVPTVPETVHADVKAYTKRKCSSENGSNENAWMLHH